MRIRHRHPRPEAVERDLARLADGTLGRSGRELTERLVAGSPELQARLREQRRAVAAARAAAQRERAPLALRLRRRTPPDRARARRRRTPALAVGLAGVIGAAVWALLTLGAGSPGLSVAQVASLATKPAKLAVAEPLAGRVTIPQLRAAGLPFPYWEGRFDWRAIGARTDGVAGRTLTTVFYRRGERSIAYTIVSGEALAAATIARFSTPGRHVVTWVRRGHTCVLSGRHIPFAMLVRLAAWRDHVRIPR